MENNNKRMDDFNNIEKEEAERVNNSYNDIVEEERAAQVSEEAKESNAESCDQQEESNGEDENAQEEVLLEKDVSKDSEEVVDVKFVEKKNSNKSKNKGMFSGKRIAALMLSGFIFAGIGGGIGSYATYRAMNGRGSLQQSAQNSVYKEGSNLKVAKESSSTQTIPRLVQEVSPAVVAVSTKSKTTAYSPFVGYTQGEREGLGTGVIFNEEGYVLTNHHVVKDVIGSSGSIKLTLNDGKEVDAKIVNYDENYDIAVLKIIDDVKLPGIATFGSSDSLTPGEGVIAIGNPVGKELLGTVTAGIVSAIDRDIDERGIKFIQTDAAISPGNSGGPLVNMNGEVIGINTEKRVGDGVEGLGFAIPIDQIKPLLNDLTKPVLQIGIGGRVVDEKIAQQYSFPLGVYVNEVYSFTPAERAGLKVGDVITKMDGIDIKTFDDIDTVKKKHKDGDVIKVVVERNGKTITLDLKLAGIN